MAKTAIGLFENSGVVDRVVRDLEALGFPRNDLRVIAEPRDIPAVEFWLPRAPIRSGSGSRPYRVRGQQSRG